MKKRLKKKIYKQSILDIFKDLNDLLKLQGYKIKNINDNGLYDRYVNSYYLHDNDVVITFEINGLPDILFGLLKYRDKYELFGDYIYEIQRFEGYNVNFGCDLRDESLLDFVNKLSKIKLGEPLSDYYNDKMIKEFRLRQYFYNKMKTERYNFKNQLYQNIEENFNQYLVNNFKDAINSVFYVKNKLGQPILQKSNIDERYRRLLVIDINKNFNNLSDIEFDIINQAKSIENNTYKDLVKTYLENNFGLNTKELNDFIDNLIYYRAFSLDLHPNCNLISFVYQDRK